MIIDVVLCVPSCEGPVRKAFDVTGVTPAVAVDRAAQRGDRARTDRRLRRRRHQRLGLPLHRGHEPLSPTASASRGVGPIILLLDHYQLDDLTFREDLFDDFVVGPFDVSELATRLRHRLRRAGNESVAPRIEHGGLSMNFETYQASIAGRVMDLTYMEYELLRFLATNPNRVFTRETLLSRVWGYEYYGGARTVDVHVRRLRAKLGEEHAHLIQTVRSVGYKFGTTPNEYARLVERRVGPELDFGERAEWELRVPRWPNGWGEAVRTPRSTPRCTQRSRPCPVRNSVALTTWSNVAPASASTERALTSAWRSCSGAPPSAMVGLSAPGTTPS